MDVKLCRLCGENTSPAVCNVFTRDGLVDLVFKYLSIKINSEDKFPTCICDVCLYKIEGFNEFVIQCQQYQVLLLSDYNKYSLELSVNLESTLKCEDNIDEDMLNSPLHEFSFGEEDSVPLSKCADKSNVRSKRKSKKHNENKLKRTKRKSNHTPNEDSLLSNKEKCIKRKLRDDSQNKKKSSSTKIKYEISTTIHDTLIKDETTAELKSEEEVIKDGETNYSYIKYDCHLCIEKFDNWSDLAEHVGWDHTVRPRVMCICKTPLYSVNAISMHVKKHGHNPTINICKECDKVFLKKDNYERHISKHVPGGKTTYCQKECPICPKVLTSIKRFNQHMRTHVNTVDKNKTKCDECNRFFATPQSVKYHKSAVHEKYKPFICDICGHAFNQRNNLESHRRVHAERPILKCDYCPRKFISKRYLRRHILCHSGVSFKCSVCGITFNYKSTLKNHMMTHQNIYKYVCGFCNKGFKWQSSLKTHLNIHTGATPYSCPWCPRSFSDRSNCRLHKRKNHPKELAEFERKNGIVHLGKTLQFDKKPASIVPLLDPEQIKVRVFPVVDQIGGIVK